jgi:hypothetical protein
VLPALQFPIWKNLHSGLGFVWLLDGSAIGFDVQVNKTGSPPQISSTYMVTKS